MHRRMVRQAIASAIPAERKKHERKHPKLDPVREAIDRMLASDRQAWLGSPRTGTDTRSPQHPAGTTHRTATVSYAILIQFRDSTE